MQLRVARFDELDPATLYAILRLRVDVFVVEQSAPYPEVDGRDTEPATVHLWFEDGGRPVAYLRMLRDGGEARIGRVCTAATHRGTGLAARLMQAALDTLEPERRACSTRRRRQRPSTRGSASGSAATSISTTASSTCR